jgi:hypothetical protein
MAPPNDGEKRLDLTHCIWCPFNLEGVCVVYQMALETEVQKPTWCRYRAVIRDPDNIDERETT